MQHLAFAISKNRLFEYFTQLNAGPGRIELLLHYRFFDGGESIEKVHAESAIHDRTVSVLLSVLQVAMTMCAYGPKRYFRHGLNIFDFVVVVS